MGKGGRGMRRGLVVVGGVVVCCVVMLCSPVGT